jgi:hypothetical protein
MEERGKGDNEAALLEYGPSIPDRNGLRHRFLDQYYEAKTKSLDLHHRVNSSPGKRTGA